jgi:hypothetical protein
MQSAVSEREERVFTAALGLMDSSHEGEGVAAFLRVRGILRSRGSGFRQVLARCQEAERLNDELGRQNAQLLRENAALRARDSRPVAAPAASPRRAFPMGDAPGVRYWDVGFMIIIATWAAFGVLGTTTAFMLAAAVLICAAFANGFSPFRFIIGALLAFAAYATATPAPVQPARPTAAAPAAFILASNVRGDFRWRRDSFPGFEPSGGMRG